VKVVRTELPDVLILEPKVFGDERGFFLESYNKRVFRQATGLDVEFVQDNHSKSRQRVLRGLHYQVHQPQGKLVRVIAGEVFDVAVDLRRGSPSFGKAAASRLDADSKRMIWVPPGFAHGFLVVSDHAEVVYKTTDYYAPEHERTLLWNDPALGIQWPLEGEPILAEKDRRGTPLKQAQLP
jgi:dTDP-4-dehydrorhamnose 3,5-epimerase